MTAGQESAVILRARLPVGLEQVRRRSVPEAAAGLPAHLTLLYPFVEPAGLDATVRRAIAAVAARHAPFDYRLLGPARWPDVVYVAVDPSVPFVALQADLAATFPDHPIYGAPADFVWIPHVTIAEGPPIDEPAVTGDPAVAGDPAWAALPRPRRVTALEVIARDHQGWRVVWRLRLGRLGRR